MRKLKLNPAQQQLVASNLRLAHAYVSSLIATGRALLRDREDLAGTAMECLVKAALTWRDGAGQKFSTHAWETMKRDVTRAQVKTIREERTVSVALNGFGGFSDRECSGGSDAFERVQADLGLVASPEEIALDHELERRHEAMLRRLEPDEREKVESVLDGRPIRPSHALALVSKLTGQAVVTEKRPRLTQAQRSARWLAGLSPAEKAARDERKNARAREARRVARERREGAIAMAVAA